MRATEFTKLFSGSEGVRCNLVEDMQMNVLCGPEHPGCSGQCGSCSLYRKRQHWNVFAFCKLERSIVERKHFSGHRSCSLGKEDNAESLLEGPRTLEQGLRGSSSIRAVDENVL